MRGFSTIFKKEMRRCFTDKRMLVSLFLPGILIFLLYTLIGNFIGNTSSTLAAAPSDTVFRIAVTSNYGHEDDPYLIQGYKAYLAQQDKNNSVSLSKIAPSELEASKTRLLNNELDVIVSFSDNFDLVFSDTSKKENNDISLFYDGSKQISSVCYSDLSYLVGEIYDGYTMNTPGGNYVSPNLSNENYLTRAILGMIFPAVTISMLFSSITSICPPSVAGEKERGTIASILLTPVKRGELLLGKATALCITAIASGVVSFAGLFTSLPSLVGGGFSYASMGAGIPLLLLLVIGALFMFVCFGLFISTLSKTSREASTYLGYMTGILLLVSFLPGLGDFSSIGYAFVPILNIAYCMSSIINGAIGDILPYIGVTIGVSVLIGLLFVFLSAKAFKEERIMVV